MVGTYVPISCSYNGSLHGKVYYMKLSWDMDNAIAYIYRGRLVANKQTAVFKRASQEGFSVDKVSSHQKMILTIQVVKLEYKDLKVICLVKDDDGRGAVIHKETTALKVIDPPKILRFKNDVINVTRGESKRIELSCTAAGYPAPIVRWKKRTTNQLIQPQTFDKDSLTARCFLPTPFTIADDGNYLCEAITRHPYMEAIGLNTAISGIRINVQYPPTIKLKEKVVYTDIGDDVTIMVDVTGNPQPTLHCSFMEIREPKFIRVRGHPSPHHFTYEVVLPNVRERHITDFPCDARNHLGMDKAVIRLRLAPSRPIITSPGRTPYCDYYPLRWSVLSKPKLQNMTVEVTVRNRTGSVMSVRSEVISLLAIRRTTLSANQTFLYHMINLTRSTDYSVRVKTCNLYQCSIFSRARHFKTSNDVGNTAPTTMYRRPAATHRPSNIRHYDDKNCIDNYGFVSTECSSCTSLQPPLLLLLLVLLTAVTRGL